MVTASTLKQYGTNEPRFLMTTVGTTEPIQPPQLIKIITAGFFRRKPGLKFKKCFGVILHDPVDYILWVLESSEYAHSEILLKRP